MFLTFWICLIVIALEKIWVWPAKYHPLTLIRLLALNIARKVHRDKNNSQFQQILSGSLAILILVIPIAGFSALLIYVAEFPYFFDAMFLYVALSFQHVVRQFKRAQASLENEKKSLARNHLSTIVLRETDKLSQMGIAKAAIESLLLRFHYQYAVVLFWYLILGGVGALVYRILYELTQVWSTKQPHYKLFGRPAALVTQLLNWIPCRLTGICMAISENLLGAIKGLGSRKAKSNTHGFLLASAGGALGIQLGGPAFYNGQKTRLEKVGGSRELRFVDMQRTLFTIHKTTAFLLVLSFLTVSILFAIAGVN